MSLLPDHRAYGNPKGTGRSPVHRTQHGHRRFEVPSVSAHLSAAIAVAEGHADAHGGKGVGLTDAMNVALAAAYRTDAMLTTDRHFRMIRPLTGHPAFRLLPDDP